MRKNTYGTCIERERDLEGGREISGGRQGYACNQIKSKSNQIYLSTTFNITFMCTCKQKEY